MSDSASDAVTVQTFTKTAARREVVRLRSWGRAHGLMSIQLVRAMPARDDLDPDWNVDQRLWWVEGPNDEVLMRDGNFRSVR